MSYQSFLRSTSGTANKIISPSSISRKPTASSTSPSPLQTSGSSVQSAVNRIQTPTSTNNQIQTPTPTKNQIQTPNSTNNVNNPPFTPTSSNASAAPPSAAVSADPTAISSPSAQGSLTKEQIDSALNTCLALQTTASTLHEKRPFAALLLGPDNTSVLLTHFSISHVQHAETELARLASIHFSQKYLATCTLVSTWEPCAMCTGTIYWSNIGRILYAASEAKLKDLTGADNEENMTLSLPCRDVLKAGQKEIEVIGPVPTWEQRVVEESGKWWKEHQSLDSGRPREGSVNGSVKTGSLSSVSLRQGTPTTWTGENNVLSSIDDEGEYTAELDIDWMR